MDIEPNTPISELVRTGIVPVWLYRECEMHGMDVAENILCKYDWGWDWDLGDGMSDTQLDVLERVRAIVKKGIEDFEANPAKVAEAKRKRELARKRISLIDEWRRKFRGWISSDQIPRIVDFFLENGYFPVFYLMFCYVNHWKRSDLQKLRYAFAGIGRETPLNMEEARSLHPEFSLKRLKSIRSSRGILIGLPLDVVNQLSDFIANDIVAEDDPIWEKFRQEQWNSEPSIQYLRMIAFFRDDYVIHTDSRGKRFLQHI